MSISILDQMSDFGFVSKYARFQETLGRRETWVESVDRDEAMHLKRFSFLPKEDLDEIKWAFDLVRQKFVAPSMRSLQFGGLAIEKQNSKMFNCSVRHINSLRSFAESFHLLLNGCGVGFGLSARHLDKIPDLVNASDKNGCVLNYVIEDSVESWADSVEVLLMCYHKNTPFTGRKIVFDYSKIREKGALLKTSGGRAPGYKGLKAAHLKMKQLLDHIIEDLGVTHLRSIDCYDILMHCADATLSGGVRRSACSVVFDKEDDLMMNAKTFFKVSSYKRFAKDEETGDYHGIVTIDKKNYTVVFDGKSRDWEYEQLTTNKTIGWNRIEPQRARSNNSVLLLRDKCTLKDFKAIIERTKQFGEPNFVFANHKDVLYNPCFTKDQRVLTTKGWRTFEYLMDNPNEFILQDNRVCGSLDDLGQKQWDYCPDCTEMDVNKVIQVAKTGYDQPVIRLYTRSGREIKCTPNHLIATPDKGMVEARNLSYNDKVLIGIGLAQSKLFYYESPDEFKLGFGLGRDTEEETCDLDGIDFKSHSFKLGFLSGFLYKFGIDIKDFYTSDHHINRYTNQTLYFSEETLSHLVLLFQEIGLDCQVCQTEGGDDLVLSNISDRTDDISFVETLPNEDVYCLQENNRHTLIVEGITVGQCFEISFIPIYDGQDTVQFCNLTTQNGALISSLEIFKKTSKAAAIIGTLQAAWAEFPYLSKEASKLTKEEALLGVSITGMMDNPHVLLDPNNQRICAEIVNETNRIWAKKLGINPAARTTCIKPEGTSSIILKSGSGIHPQHSKRYIRRIQCNKMDIPYKYFKKHNPHAVEESVWSANKTDDVISFPVEIPDGAMVKSDLTAIEHLKIIKSTQENWVLPGSNKPENKKPIENNVSCTVLIDEHEWDDVIKYLFDNRRFFAAVSLLPKMGDKIYQQAPFEAIVTKEDEAKFEALLKDWKPVDYTKMKETDDRTTLRQEISCAGGQCEVNF